jgi:hypothetical protein
LKPVEIRPHAGGEGIRREPLIEAGAASLAGVEVGDERGLVVRRQRAPRQLL